MISPPPSSEAPAPSGAHRPGAGPPAPFSPAAAIARRWWVIVLAVLVLGGAAVAVATVREPKYTASSDINVGRIDVRVQALSGFVAGAQSLAETYSRVVTSGELLEPIGQQVGLEPAEVASRLSATSVPRGTFFTISGSGPTEADALALTKAATEEMQAWVEEHESGGDSTEVILDDYTQATRRAARLQREYESLKAERDRALGAGTAEDGDAPSPDDVSAAQVAYEKAQLRAQALAGQYSSRSNELAGTAGVELVRSPVTAESDRATVRQKLLAVGIGAGLLIGAALAIVMERSAARRRRLRVR